MTTKLFVPVTLFLRLLLVHTLEFISIKRVLVKDAAIQVQMVVQPIYRD